MLSFDKVVLAQGGFRLTTDWSLPAASRAAIIGPSGGGKSTLLLALAGFLAPVQGHILWQGTDLAGVPPGERPLSMLFQDQNLFPHLTLQQNLGLGLAPNRRLSTDEEARITQTLIRVGLAGFDMTKPGQLSGGQQARAALARALLRARPLLLLDEPFAALGPALKSDMLDLVTEVASETAATVLMVTHDPADALRFADHCVLVAEGRADAPRPTKALFDDPPAALRSYLGTK
jgi:thiamine transport system ATP-binding protein